MTCTSFCFAANVSDFLNPEWFAKLSNACWVKLIIGTKCQKAQSQTFQINSVFIANFVM
jgi:hypothetical protein